MSRATRMGRLIYAMNVSLDGFVATTDGSLAWATIDEELHGWFNDQARTSQASLYGRRMYELMAGYWPTADEDPSAVDVEREFARIWKRLPKVVFSSSLDHVDHNARLVAGDVGTVLEELRRDLDGDIDVSGPDLAGQFVERGLVDVFKVVVHPVALGTGMPFWPELAAPIRLRLVERRAFASGVEARSYVPA